MGFLSLLCAFAKIDIVMNVRMHAKSALQSYGTLLYDIIKCIKSEFENKNSHKKSVVSLIKY